jgi:hypothetical protein
MYPKKYKTLKIHAIVPYVSDPSSDSAISILSGGLKPISRYTLVIKSETRSTVAGTINDDNQPMGNKNIASITTALVNDNKMTIRRHLYR